MPAAEDSKLLDGQAMGNFWIKLSKEPDHATKIPNLVLSVEGVGDSFAGRQVPMKIIIENQDSYMHQVISSSVSDPCQVGIRVKNAKGKIIYDDFKKRICPLWPKLEDLSIGGKKEYNYLWEAPATLKGNYTVDIYFNYSRLFGNQLIKSSSINLK
jgi:hypothetical protein